MVKTLNYQDILNLHKHIADVHKDINGFFTVEDNVNANLREGIGLPCLALDNQSNALSGDYSKIFTTRTISLIVFDNAIVTDDYALQNQIHTRTEKICMDIIAYLWQLAKNDDSSIVGKFKPDTVTMQPVFNIFGACFGWHLRYQLTNNEVMNWPERSQAFEFPDNYQVP